MITSDSSVPLVDAHQRVQRIIRPLPGLANDALPEYLENIFQASDQLRVDENAKKGWFGTRLQLDERDGEGYWECCKFSDDFFVVVSDFTCAEERSDRLPGTGLLDIHVKIKGATTFTPNGDAPQLLRGPGVWAGTNPVGHTCYLNMHAEKELSVTLFFKPDYFYDNLATQIGQIPDRLAHYIFNHSRGVLNYELPMSAEILDAASGIVHSGKRFNSKLWLSHIHGRSEELICYVIEAFDQQGTFTRHAYSQVEIEQLRAAKNIVAEQFTNAPTIVQIAKQVGTCQTKLKQGFRSLFGETVFEFRNRLRMEKASELIKTGVPIAQVSEQVGYQQQASFARAFKAYYGYSPKACRLGV